jgi:hypothetical protein
MAKYDRFWDVHYTAENGWYDFGANIESQGTYQTAGHETLGGKIINLIDPAQPTGPGIIRSRAPGPQELPERGYVVSTVTKGDITGASNAKAPDPKFADIIKWVANDSHLGKIRLNAHGQEGGYMFMGTAAHGDPARRQDIVQVVWFGLFLIQNGLKDAWGTGAKRYCFGGGLKTISLAMCHAAQEGERLPTDPARTPGSAVKDLVAYLKDQSYTGIEVTGTIETVAVRPTQQGLRDEAKRVMYKEFAAKKLDIGSLGQDDLAALVVKEYNDDKASYSKLSPDMVTLIGQLENQLKGASRVTTPLDELRRLYEQLRIAPFVDEVSGRFPQGSKPGQWGHYIKSGDRTSWVRLAHSNGGKFSLKS